MCLTVVMVIAAGKKSRFVTEDGVEIVGNLWIPEQDQSPCVILLHMLEKTRADWDDIRQSLFNKGYAVVSIDLRGHGESTKQGDAVIDVSQFTEDDFQNMVLDVQAVLKELRENVRIDNSKIAIMGASIGANVGLQAAASDPLIPVVVLLSPGKSYRGIRTDTALLDYGKRPILIAASEEDGYAANSSQYLKELAQGYSKLLMYNNIGHGTEMFKAPTDLEEEIIDWLDTYLK
jgi:pimeloyl-ACP methyl ester carboxylesterase